jgi:hypothetical protein
MRAREFIAEDDSGNSTSINNLIGALETVRDRFGDTEDEAKIRLDSLIHMVKELPGSEMFNVDSLMKAYDKNDSIKNLISGVRDDDSGNKMVYITPVIGDIDDTMTIGDAGDDGTSAHDMTGSNPRDTVSSMSKRALNRR